MKRIVSLLLAWTLTLCLGAAAAEDAAVLGQPIPDFTVIDTDGNSFTLSEKLKDHQGVLINIRAAWCPPCKEEMQILEEAYEQYGDRVAFIALSNHADDTLERIRAFRQEMGIQFPMGWDEGAALQRHIIGSGLPATAIVDRFGNTVFVKAGSFANAGEVMRTLDAFLGESYAKTAPLTQIPKDASTRAFQVSAARAIRVENEDAKAVFFWKADDPQPQLAYVIHDDIAHLRLEITASDDPSDMVYNHFSDACSLQDLLDTGRVVFAFDQPMPDAAADTPYVYGWLLNRSLAGGDSVGVFLSRGEAGIEKLAEDMRSFGWDVTWEYVDFAQLEPAQAQAYLLHVVDQNGAPVPGMMVNFCTDKLCTMVKSDENGLISFNGAPDVYHVQLLKAPEGYGFDPDFELYTDAAWGEWVLRIQKKQNP